MWLIVTNESCKAPLSSHQYSSRAVLKSKSQRRDTTRATYLQSRYFLYRTNLPTANRIVLERSCFVSNHSKQGWNLRDFCDTSSPQRESVAQHSKVARRGKAYMTRRGETHPKSNFQQAHIKSTNIYKRETIAIYKDTYNISHEDLNKNMNKE